ncbi:MAG: hypothetical protein AAFY88_25570, partial [Acidobacteriota bacterium]
LTPSFFAGADRALASLAGELGVPAVAPVTLRAEESSPVNRHVFYLWSGIEGQARALARFAARGDPVRVAVVAPTDGRLDDTAAAIAAELGPEVEIDRIQLGGQLADESRNAAAALAADGAVDLFLLDTGPSGLAFLAAAEQADWRPRVLVPGSLAGRGLLQAAGDIEGPLLLAYPTLPDDRRGDAAQDLRRLSAQLSLPPGSETLVVPVFAGVRLLVEGLERSGRELSRERLIGALEGLYDHPTWLTPALTYGPNRRVGARGAYVVAIRGGDSPSAASREWVPIGR